MLDSAPNLFGSGKPALTLFAIIMRLAAIGIVMAVTAAAFAYAGGWLTPGRLTPDRMMAAFAGANGEHPGFRRNHAKGVCATGWFESNGQAATLSKAAVFAPGRVPVIGRFALAGGLPDQPDKPGTVRSLALRFMTQGGDEWRTGMNNIPVFPVNSAPGFYEQLIAATPDPGTGKPDPERTKAFLAGHPEVVAALALIGKRSVSSGFADSTFNGLIAFRFVDAAGKSVPVRWSVVPLQAVLPESTAQAAADDKNYLFDDLGARVAQHPLQWRLVVTVGEPGDPTDDATLPWPPDRRQVDAGTVTIEKVTSENGGGCTDVNYDPLVLPSGIEPSDDPLLSARSAAYARSFTLRAAEAGQKPPSAVGAAVLGGGDGR